MPEVYVNGHLKPGAEKVTRGMFFGYDAEPEDDHEMTPEETTRHLEAFVRRFNKAKLQATGQSVKTTR